MAQSPDSKNTPHHSKPAELQAVIFDVDGTLAETERDGHRVAYNQAFAEQGIDWHWTIEEHRKLLGIAGGKERLRRYATNRTPDHAQQSGFDDWINRLYQRKSEIYASIVLAGKIPLRPGVRRLLEELRQGGVRLAVATTTDAANLNCLTMANLGCSAESLFEVIGAGDQVSHKKPAADIYEWVLEKLDLPAAACLAVEDARIGLDAARGAGIPTVVTVSDYSDDADFPGALTIVSGLGEPIQPVRHLGGHPLSGSCVDLGQLREWHNLSR